MTEKTDTKQKEKKEFVSDNLKKEKKYEALVRILSTDIPAKMSVYAGLTKIKGISWAISSAICHKLNIDKTRKLSTLTENEIEKISDCIKNLSQSQLPAWLLNRRKDRQSGEDKHLLTSELDLQREFDIRHMKKIRSYKGIRHMLGQPVRGQRTRSHFRQGKTVGVSRVKTQPQSAAKSKSK